VRSGLARVLGCALFAAVASCDPLSYGERAQLAIGDGDIIVDDASVSLDDAPPPPVDSPVEGPTDASIDAGTDAMIDAGTDAMTDAGTDAMTDAGTDAMTDAGTDAMPDAPPDSMVDAAIPDAPVTPPDAVVDAGVTDGGPGDGSLTDALGPDAREPPGLPVGGSHDDNIQSFYACSTGDGASALPLLLAILALRRRSYRGSGVT
jgi:hypothetical protein